MVDLMVRPPAPGEESHARFAAERAAILGALRRKSALLHGFLNSIDGVSCQPLQGAMYAFPRIELPPRAVAEALAEGHAPDTHYALSLLEHTGICAVPGSGFGQREGTHHLRLTFLPEEAQLLRALDRFRAHHDMYLRKYS